MNKSFNIDPELWDEALKKAKANQQSLSAVISKLLLDWLKGKIVTCETSSD